MGPDGTFTPALDGPNPERPRNRNNVGDVWVVAAHAPAGGETLSARAHLVVTVPLYLRWEPWRITEEQLPSAGGDR
jgi:quinohemoprotein amine dehydrogenase